MKTFFTRFKSTGNLFDANTREQVLLIQVL